ncbi:MAG: hypothetical protein ACI9C2_000844 [Gammaproteobacteria bacterium]|jgi:hypothetical protein
MKSIWIPLALCATLAPMSTAFAAQKVPTDGPTAIERAKLDLAEAQARLKVLLSEQQNMQVEWTTTHTAAPEAAAKQDKDASKGKFWSYGTKEAPASKDEAELEHFLLAETGLVHGHGGKGITHKGLSLDGSGEPVANQSVWIDEDGVHSWTTTTVPHAQHEGAAGLPVVGHHSGASDFDFAEIEGMVNAHGGQVERMVRLELLSEGDSADGQVWLTMDFEHFPAHGQHPVMGGHGTAPHGTAPHGSSPHGSSPHGNSPHGNSPHGNSPHGNSPHGKGAPQVRMERLAFPVAHPGMGNATGSYHDQGGLQSFRLKGSATCSECGGPKTGGKSSGSPKMLESHGMIEMGTPFGSMNSGGDHQVEIIINGRVMELQGADAASSCSDCECSASACEGDLEGDVQNFFMGSTSQGGIGYEAEVCEESTAFEIEVSEEQVVCELEGAEEVDFAETIETFTWALESDDMDGQIDALIHELGGNNVTTEVRVIRLDDLASADDFTEIDALIAELEGELATSELDALLAELEADLATFESEVAIEFTAPVVAKPVAKSVDAKVEALESKVAELEAIIESLVKELNQR